MPSQRNQAPAPVLAPIDNGLPPALRYKAAPEVVRLHEQLSVAFASLKQWAAASPNQDRRLVEAAMRVASVAEGGIAMTTLVQADLANWTEQVLALQQGAGPLAAGEALLGLDEETVDDLTAELDKIDKVLSRIEAGTIGGENAKLEAKAARKSVEDIKAAFEELLIEEEDEDDVADDSDDGEEEEDEEEDDSPLQVEG